MLVAIFKNDCLFVSKKKKKIGRQFFNSNYITSRIYCKYNKNYLSQIIIFVLGKLMCCANQRSSLHEINLQSDL